MGVNCLTTAGSCSWEHPLQLGGVLCQLFCPGRLTRTGLIHHYYKKVRTRNCPCLYPEQPPGVLFRGRVVLQSQLHDFVQNSRSPGEVHPCRSIPFSPASPSAWQTSSHGPETPWGGLWAVCTRNKLWLPCSASQGGCHSQGGQDRWVEDPFYHCQRAVLNKLLPWAVLSAVPTPAVPGGTALPCGAGGLLSPKISICCSVTAQVRLT